MNWRDLECQTINPCICNSLYRRLFLINHYYLFVSLRCVSRGVRAVSGTHQTIIILYRAVHEDCCHLTTIYRALRLGPTRPLHIVQWGWGAPDHYISWNEAGPTWPQYIKSCSEAEALLNTIYREVRPGQPDHCISCNESGAHLTTIYSAVRLRPTWPLYIV